MSSLKHYLLTVENSPLSYLKGILQTTYFFEKSCRFVNLSGMFMCVLGDTTTFSVVSFSSSFAPCICVKHSFALHNTLQLSGLLGSFFSSSFAPCIRVKHSFGLHNTLQLSGPGTPVCFIIFQTCLLKKLYTLNAIL
jgi:hypothetical protein